MRVLSMFMVAAAIEGPNGCASLLHARGDDAGTAPATAPATGPAAGPASSPLSTGGTGAQHLANGTQLEAQGKLVEAAKEYDAAADQFRAEGNLGASVDARKRSAAVQEKYAAQLTHGGTAPKTAPQPKPGPAPGPGPAPSPAPAPAPANATGGIPNGLYLCHGRADNGYYAVLRRIQITGANYLLYTYNDREKIPGTYRLDGTKVTWLSGPLAGHGQGDYEPDTISKGNMVLVFIDAITPVPGAHRCYITNSAPP